MLNVRRTFLPTAVLLLAVAAAACSSAATAGADGNTPTAPASATSGSLPKATLEAMAVTNKIAKAIPSVKLTVTYDATTDPNGRLGRPHQYVSKTAFDDTRVSDKPKAAEDAVQGRRDSISYGGTVEVFSTADDAAAWLADVDRGQQAISGLMLPDYLFRHDRVVVRVSHLLTPEQAAEYEKAIS